MSSLIFYFGSVEHSRHPLWLGSHEHDDCRLFIIVFMKRSSYSLPPTQSIFDFLSLILIYRFLSFQSSIEYVDDASDYKRLMMITSVLPKRNEGEKQKVETMQSR